MFGCFSYVLFARFHLEASADGNRSRFNGASCPGSAQPDASWKQRLPPAAGFCRLSFVVGNWLRMTWICVGRHVNTLPFSVYFLTLERPCSVPPLLFSCPQGMSAGLLAAMWSADRAGAKILRTGPGGGGAAGSWFSPLTS